MGSCAALVTESSQEKPHADKGSITGFGAFIGILVEEFFEILSIFEMPLGMVISNALFLGGILQVILEPFVFSPFLVISIFWCRGIFFRECYLVLDRFWELVVETLAFYISLDLLHEENFVIHGRPVGIVVT